MGVRSEGGITTPAHVKKKDGGSAGGTMECKVGGANHMFEKRESKMFPQHMLLLGEGGEMAGEVGGMDDGGRRRARGGSWNNLNNASGLAGWKRAADMDCFVCVWE